MHKETDNRGAHTQKKNSEKAAVCKPRREAPGITKPANTLILDSRTMGNKFLFKTQLVVCWYSSLRKQIHCRIKRICMSDLLSVCILRGSNENSTGNCKMEIDTFKIVHLTFKNGNSMNSKNCRWVQLNWIPLTAFWTGLLNRWLVSS